jgi:hypothetical protein
VTVNHHAEPLQHRRFSGKQEVPALTVESEDRGQEFPHEAAEHEVRA